MRCYPLGIALAASLGIATAAIASVPAAADNPIGVLSFADADGRTITLDAPGVLYMVDFWALGCKPCIQEMPELERLAKEYEPGGRFRFVSVVFGGWEGKALRTVAEEAGASLPVHSDPEDWLGRLEINAFPTKLLIRDGKVLQQARGGGAGAYIRWKRVIGDQLREAPVAKQP